MQKQIRLYTKFCLYLIGCVFLFSNLCGIAYGADYKFRDTPRIRGDLPRIREIIRVHKRHSAQLMNRFGVIATAAGISQDGEPVVKVFTSQAGIAGIPDSLDGVPVVTEITDRVYALQEPPPLPTERWDRPVPIGISTGHPAITAGTIGARVTDGSSFYALSNNHVYADINNANIGDDVIQPGRADGGSLPNDLIGTLTDYEPITFCQVFWIWLICSETNTIDAAIADVSYTFGEPDVGVSTPPDGYGTPNTIIHPAYGVPEVINDGDEDLAQLLGLSVQKYGRTTSLTIGTIDAINATVDVCYDQACSKVARFVDQIIITPGTFSAGGDSGSLIVTNDDDKNPVALLYAGSSTQTIANRIDRVLTAFNVSIDSETPPAITAIEVNSSPPATSPSVEVGQNLQFNAVGTFEDGSPPADITESVAWNSSNTDVATIDSTGLATGKSAGTADITATKGGVTSDPVTLTVTPSTITLKSITISSDCDSISIGETCPFSATGTYSDGSTADLTSAVDWFSENEAIAIFNQPGIATGMSEGTVVVYASFYDSFQEATITSNTVTLEVTAPPVSSGPYLQIGIVSASTADWTLETLDHDYGDDMVVICTPNYEYDALFLPEPLVAHVKNAIGNSFQVKLVQAVGGSLQDVSADVHYMVVKAGVYTLAEHGVKMEAVKFNSTITDGLGSWVGQNRSYTNSYINPVVVGQVMTYNADRAWYWSVFWCRGSSRSSPPSSTELWVGKHKAQDPRAVNNETLGYVVIEAGEGEMDTASGTARYFAALGSDTVRGIDNSPPYTYSLTEPSFTPSTAILSQAAMDGRDGGWAVLYGPSPVTYSALKLAIEEDMAWDSERKHTTEQVGYIVFE
jgi:hypothetical protein